MEVKISVIMSVYNASETIEDAIKSILSQTYTNFEFLILDDASEDDSYKKITKYKGIDSRIKIFKNKKNEGLTNSLNKLINEASGTHIARQDADDISKDIRLEEQVKFLSKYHVVTARAKIKQNIRRTIPGLSYYLPTSLTIRLKNPYIHGTLLIDKKLLDKLGGYNEDYKYAQDYRLFLDIHNMKIKVKNLRKPLYILNTKDNISSNKKVEQDYFFKLARKSQKQI